MVPWTHPTQHLETSSRSVQPFLHSSRQSVSMLIPTIFPSILLFVMGILAPSNRSFLGPTRVHSLNGISIGSAVFAGPIVATDRLTDRRTGRPRYSVCNNRPHLRSTAKWSNNETDRKTSTSDLQAVAFCNQGRSDGGYIGIYTLPKSVPENYFVH